MHGLRAWGTFSSILHAPSTCTDWKLVYMYKEGERKGREVEDEGRSTGKGESRSSLRTIQGSIDVAF